MYGFDFTPTEALRIVTWQFLSCLRRPRQFRVEPNHTWHQQQQLKSLTSDEPRGT